MTLTVHQQIEQRSEQWHDQRRGLITASAIGGLLTPTLKVADNDTSRALIAVLVAERINGWTEDNWISSDMMRGIEHEPYALEAYTERTGSAVESCGFMVLEGDGWTIGYSPDALVDEDGLVEVKCPRAKGHLQTILRDSVPAYYMAQLQAGLLVSGREWVDFVSFCAGMPLFIKRVTPSPDWHAALIAAATAFELTAAEMVATYRNATKGLAVTERVETEMRL